MNGRMVPFLVWLLSLVTLGTTAPVFAYRPFESTDADVVARGELEIEWGALTVERLAGETAYIFPDLVFNVGMSQRTEMIGEFVVERTPDRQWEVSDAGAFVKTVWREGLLQGESGVSFATEAGLLLPGTSDEEDGVGAEGIAIASLRVADFTLHFNAGGGVTRDAGDPFALGGVIAEYPLADNFILVGEINGEVVSGEDHESSLLVGGLWEPEGFAGEMDFALRTGLTGGDLDWSLTLGATFPFQLF